MQVKNKKKKNRMTISQVAQLGGLAVSKDRQHMRDIVNIRWAKYRAEQAKLSTPPSPEQA